MAGSIADFKSSFSTDLARPSRFDIDIPIPIGMFPYLQTGRLLKLRCENAELPGRAISTTSMKIYGVEEQFPYMTSFGDISLTFIVGDDMAEKIFFDAWLEWINPTVTYNLKYKTDYAVPLRINQYDVENKLSYSVDLYDAYPKGINQMNLDWSADGNHKLTVTFAYTNWRNNSVEAAAMQLLEEQIYTAVSDVIQTASNLGTDIVSEGAQTLRKYF